MPDQKRNARSHIYKDQPKVPTKLPEVRDIEVKDKMHKFDGAWMPNLDPALIGAENFQTLINMRYNDGGIEGVNGYDDVNTTAIVDYTDIRNGIHFRTNRSADSYVVIQAKKDFETQSRLYVNKTAIGSQGDFATGIGQQAAGSKGAYLWEDASADLIGRFAHGPSGTISYCNEEESNIWSGEEAAIGAVFTVDDAALTDPVDVTEKLTNTRTDASNRVTIDSAGRDYIVVMTTRPAQSFKFYVYTANGDAADLAVTCWDGDDFGSVPGNQVDGTKTAGATLAKTGEYTFDFVDRDTAKPMHFEERYLYAYRFSLSAGDAVISEITANFPMQAPTNVWDGLYRVPIQCQFYNQSVVSYEDFTLHVSESSTLNTPVGAILDGMTTLDTLTMMFEDQLAGIKFTMLANLVNETAARTLVLKYWDGDAWQALTVTDGTSATADKMLSQSGLVSWDPPSDEEKQTLFGTIGYAYQLSNADGSLSGAEGGDEEIVIDLIDGIPARKEIEIYKFPTAYKNKTFMCGYVQGNEGNRIDFCADNAPDVWNGEDTSMDSFQSIYVGGIEELTGARQLYNRFGSNIFAFLILFKNAQMYMLTGDGPLDYKLYPVSFTIGCPAPETIATAEVGLEVGENVARNVVMWISHSGPMMFDGATLQRIEGLEPYFDPNDSRGVNFDQMEKFKGWFDSTYREWNVLLATGSSQTSLNSWFCYDIVRKKWFEKSVGSADKISCGFNTIATNGDQYIYAGSTIGKLFELETDTTWNETPMTNTVQTGDFFPSGNQWDITNLRRIKLAAKRIEETGADVNLYYYKDTDTSSGVVMSFLDITATQSNAGNAGIAFLDITTSESNGGNAGIAFLEASSSTFDLSVDQGTRRLIRTTNRLNREAWAHSIKWVMTSSDTAKGFQPIGWGYQWYWRRKDV